MCYKVSMTAEISVIEKEMGAFFKYPKLYKPNKVIYGLCESSLAVVTQEDKNSIDYGIWGLLPHNSNEDWSVIQGIRNTLTIHKNKVLLKKDAIGSRRCLIIVTGFYTHRLVDGLVYPYYVHMDSKLFLLAGIYNVLEDGFITCSLITEEANDFINEIQNIETTMPKILDAQMARSWLNPSLKLNEIGHVLTNQH